MILAIDPANEKSAYVVIDGNLKPIKFGKIKNSELMEKIKKQDFEGCKVVAIEMIASYGMAVGQTVFDTCVWIGRFIEAVKAQGMEYELIYRKEVKMNLCNTMRANDSNIIQALVDRFAPNVRNKGKGIKSDKGFFYGFRADIWQSYAVGVTYHDTFKE